MSTGTTLVAFKQALVTALSARPRLAGVQISYGFPDTEIWDESIWIEGARAELGIPTMTVGTKRVEENYSLTVACQVLRTQAEGQDVADLRAAQLLVELQQALAEKPELIPEILWAEIDGWTHHVGALAKSDGHGSRFDVRVRVRARLHP